MHQTMLGQSVSRKAFPCWNEQQWDDITPRRHPAEKGHQHQPRPSCGGSSQHYPDLAELPRLLQSESHKNLQDVIFVGERWQECLEGYPYQPMIPSLALKQAAARAEWSPAEAKTKRRGGKSSHARNYW